MTRYQSDQVITIKAGCALQLHFNFLVSEMKGKNIINIVHYFDHYDLLFIDSSINHIKIHVLSTLTIEFSDKEFQMIVPIKISEILGSIIYYSHL